MFNKHPRLVRFDPGQSWPLKEAIKIFVKSFHFEERHSEAHVSGLSLVKVS